ncbi:hypothetical protein ACP70R_036915 [Stipagrostis hirtigluma subsp. patula]
MCTCGGTVEKGKVPFGAGERQAVRTRTVSAQLFRQTISSQSSTSSCSPPEVPRYKLRATTSRCKRRKMAGAGRAYWDSRLTQILLELCIAEKEKLNFNSKKGPTKVGWRNIKSNFRQQTGRAYDSKQLQNKFHSLKRLYKLWKKLKTSSGAGWDSNTGTIVGDDDWWNARIEENEQAVELRGRPLEHEQELSILFGGFNTQEGNMLYAGGYGDRTPPARAADDVRVPTAGDDQRPGREQVVDSPPPKRTKSSMEYYVERISESMLERSRNESNARRQEQSELREMLQVLVQDGVPKNSELYFIATELLRSASRREAFRSLDDAETRSGWLLWTWANARKN